MRINILPVFNFKRGKNVAETEAAGQSEWNAKKYIIDDLEFFECAADVIHDKFQQINIPSFICLCWLHRICFSVTILHLGPPRNRSLVQTDYLK